MVNPFQSPVILSFCAGLLGIEKGLARAGVNCRVAAYIEIEAFIIANLLTGMESGVLDTAPIWTDATTFDASPFRGRIHGIVGGYPCPGESLAGLREGHLYKGFIWPSIRRSIAAARPLWCFFENVDDHLTGTYPIVQRSLRNMGYAVEAGIYSAAEVGAPHERQRIFILALDDSLRKRSWTQYPIPAGGNSIVHANETMDHADDGRQRDITQSDDRGAERKQIPQRNDVQESGKSGELDDTDSTKHKRRGSHTKAGRTKSSNTGAGELANAAIKRSQKSGRATSGQHHKAGDELANAESIGIQGIGREGEQITGLHEGQAIPVRDGRGMDRWPAGQGYFQHDWEEPRTVEPKMGVSVDGYDFRSDFIRAFGNAVVPQQAEVAFIDLLKKHNNGK